MRHGLTVLFGLLTMLLGSCIGEEAVRRTSLFDAMRSFQGPTGPDVVQLDIALIEQPVGNPYINEELWTSAVERVPMERKRLMEDNGFRIGQIGGITPAGLLTLLTSRESCTMSQQMRRHASDPATLSLGPTVARCQVSSSLLNKTSEGSDATEVYLTFEQADCVLAILPTLTGDGRTRLRFTPTIQHGVPRTTLGSAPDTSGWALRQERQQQVYDNLSWELTLAADEYAIIGGRIDRPGTLGHVGFIRPAEERPVQHCL